MFRPSEDCLAPPCSLLPASGGALPSLDSAHPRDGAPCALQWRTRWPPPPCHLLLLGRRQRRAVARRPCAAASRARCRPYAAASTGRGGRGAASTGCGGKTTSARAGKTPSARGGKTTSTPSIPNGGNGAVDADWTEGLVADVDVDDGATATQNSGSGQVPAHIEFQRVKVSPTMTGLNCSMIFLKGKLWNFQPDGMSRALITRPKGHQPEVQ